MWFLEHESLFGGKRVWLRPGSQQLYGRTTKGANSEGGRSVFIDHKAVSRQHMMIKVLNVPAEGGTKLHARSQIEITDLSCRQGTYVDEDKKLMSKKEGGSVVEYDRLILSGTEHRIKLISSYPSFRLIWQPVVFTFASKESKSRSNQLHALDIKTSSDFVFHKTTHVVSQKRNLPKVLQGLVAGVHIVTTDYLDAIIDRASPQNTDPDNYRPSKLEEDFDIWWPKEKEYIPSVGAEPVPRDGRLLEPDTRRAEVFSGLTFVFLNENQHRSLHEPIAGGGGKVLLFDVRPGETTVDEYVEYVHNVAGKKKSAKVSNGRLPVITIRLPAFPDGLEEWASRFVTGVDQALDQRSILQNEFLDAIISNDCSSLQRPPAVVEPVSSGPQASLSENFSNEHAARPQVMAPSQPLETAPSQADEPAKPVSRKRPIRRGATTSRFTGFDDYEPPAKLRKVEEDTPMNDAKTSNHDEESNLSSQARRFNTQRSQRYQSPALPSVEPREEGPDQMDTLFPAAAAVKRQRAVTRGMSASVDPETQAAAPRQKTKGEEVLERLQKAKKKASKDIDVREAARLRLQEQEEKRKADEDGLREALEGVDISEIRGLVQVEEMEIKPRERRGRQQADGSGQRWNDEWNGRKNFKKFRRRGGQNVPHREKVIVALEQAPQKKGFGLGDAFFLEEEPSTSRDDEQRRIRKKARADVVSGSESEPEPGFTRRNRTKQPEIIDVEDSGPEDAVVPASAGTRASGRTQRVEETQLDNPQIQTQTSTQRGAKKRGAVTVAAGPSKRARTRRREDDSDDEETGFRLRKRG